MSQEDTKLSTEELIKEALSFSDVYHSRRWDFVILLQDRQDAAFEASVKLCRSEDPHSRRLGVDILAELGTTQKAFHNEVLAIFLDMLEKESDEDVLQALGSANGLRNYQELVPYMAQMAAHPNNRVRVNAVHGLLGQKSDTAIQTLVMLTEDGDAGVRQWATSGLGSDIDTNTEEIREALANRLADEDAVVRGEALIGLAIRHDGRTVDAIADELLRGYQGNTDYFVLRAVAEIYGDQKLLPMLTELRGKLEWAKPDHHGEYFDTLIEIATSGPRHD